MFLEQKEEEESGTKMPMGTLPKGGKRTKKGEAILESMKRSGSDLDYPTMMERNNNNIGDEEEEEEGGMEGGSKENSNDSLNEVNLWEK
jgi:hypothetical protein